MKGILKAVKEELTRTSSGQKVSSGNILHWKDKIWNPLEEKGREGDGGVGFRKRLIHRYTPTKGSVFIILLNRKLRDTSVNWTHHRLCHSRSSQIYPGSGGNQRLQLSHCKQNETKYLISNKIHADSYSYKIFKVEILL